MTVSVVIVDGGILWGWRVDLKSNLALFSSAGGGRIEPEGLGLALFLLVEPTALSLRDRQRQGSGLRRLLRRFVKHGW